MIDASFVESIKELTRNGIKIRSEGFNEEFVIASGELVRIPKTFTKPIATLFVSTLGSFANLVNKNLDDASPDTHVIVVDSPTSVFMITEAMGEAKIREIPLEANADVPIINFGTYMEIEKMIITLRTQFEDTEDVGTLIKLLSSVIKTDQVELQDSGYSQRVAVSKGVSGVDQEWSTVPGIVSLAPHRTFRELNQPVSDFLVRLSSNMGTPTVALFEADGGGWKLDAKEAIVNHLVDILPDTKYLITW